MSPQALQMKLQTLQLQAKRLSEELNKVSIEIIKTEGALEYLQGKVGPGLNVVREKENAGADTD